MNLQEKHMNFLYGALFIIGAVILNGLSIILGSINAPVAVIHIHFVLAILVALIGLYYLFQAFFGGAFSQQQSE